MIENLIIIASGLCAALSLWLIVGAIWHHPNMARVDRIALGMLGAGIVWGGVNRAQGVALGLGDLLLLVGIVMMLARFVFHHPILWSARS